MTELMLYEPLLNVGGTILSHDSLYFDGVGTCSPPGAGQPPIPGHSRSTPAATPFTVIAAQGDHPSIVRKDPRRVRLNSGWRSRYLGWNVGDPLSPAYLRS